MQRGEPTILPARRRRAPLGAGPRRIDRHRRAVERDVDRSRSRAWLARSAGVSVIRIRSARQGVAHSDDARAPRARGGADHDTCWTLAGYALTSTTAGRALVED